MVDTSGFGDTDNDNEVLIEEMTNVLVNVVFHAKHNLVAVWQKVDTV